MNHETASVHMSAAASAEALIASIQDCAIYIVDLGGRVASWNPRLLARYLPWLHEGYVPR